MIATGNPRSHERGMALVISMLVLLVLTLLGSVMMASIMMNRRSAGQGTTMRQALNSSEAGIGEAISRLRNGDAPMPTNNPRAVSQIFLAPAGSIPPVGADTTAMPTKQPAGNWLNYSTTDKTPDVLTIAFKTDPARTVIYRYDITKNPSIQTATGLPIYQVTSTGRAGNAKCTVVADVVAKPITTLAHAALCTNEDVDYVGNAIVCGFNHSAATPPPTGEAGRGNAPDCVPYEINSGDLPATWSTGGISGGGAAYQTGSPVANLPNQTGFYAGPWELLSMSQTEFESFVGPPVVNPTNLNGIVYADNDLVMGNQSGGVAFQSTSGEGLLYIDGDLTINAGFTYVGLIYVEGNLQMNGQAWVLGGMVVKGKTNIKVNGGATILYSSDAIQQKLAQYGGMYTTLAWRQK